MSFILDALRKSESERQRTAVAGITHVPLAVQKRSLPAWAVAVMLLLGIGVLTLTGAWWASTRSDAEHLAAGGSRAAASQSAAPPVQSNSLAEAARSASRPVPSGSSAATPRPDQPTPRSTSRASTSRGVALIPSAAALAAEGVELPGLELELHVFADSAADRYVFINGSMYREGDTLREGPRLVRIERAGAVLSQHGREFSLSQQ